MAILYFSLYNIVSKKAGFKAAVNTMVPRSPFFCFLYPKISTVANIK